MKDFARIIHTLAPIHSVADSAPDTFEDLMRHDGLLIWSGGTETAIFDAETNWAFRAWHDARHKDGGFGFDRDGEVATFEAQALDLRRIGAEQYIPILHCEVVGQLEHFEKFGSFVKDQRRFTELYLLDPALALEESR